ncbi:MAG: hypothetical protein RI885_601 [Actinomycetota bacterium]|jgi:hypothetical protein
MRWDNLFDDLEGQLEQELTAEEVDLRAEEERLRLGRLSLRDRLVAVHAREPRHSSYSLKVQLADGSHLDIGPRAIGKDWLSGDLAGEHGRAAQCVLPLSAIASLVLTREQVTRTLDGPLDDANRSLSTRLTLSFVLRDLCRRRSSVELRLRSGILFGTIDRVGRDHLDLAEHEAGSARRESVVTRYRVIPFDQVLLVRL